MAIRYARGSRAFSPGSGWVLMGFADGMVILCEFQSAVRRTGYARTTTLAPGRGSRGAGDVRATPRWVPCRSWEGALGQQPT